MTHPDMDPDLQRLGEALHASATVDLARERRATRPTRRAHPSSRVLASSTLALMAAGAAVLLALSGTAAVSPAYAITQRRDGNVFVKINFGGHNTLTAADGNLIDRYHETVLVDTAPGQSTNSAPIDCTPTADQYAAGDPLPTGPRVRLLMGADNTFVRPLGRYGSRHPAPGRVPYLRQLPPQQHRRGQHRRGQHRRYRSYEDDNIALGQLGQNGNTGG